MSSKLIHWRVQAGLVYDQEDCAHPEFPRWYAMLWRCHGPRSAWDFPRYAGRGIVVFPGWFVFRDYAAYVAAELGPRPPGMTVDRIDNEGNYEPGNIRWADRSQQRRNKTPPGQGKQPVEPPGERPVAPRPDDEPGPYLSGFMAETERLDDFRRRYGASLATACKWLKAGLPSMKVGRERRVHTATADQWLRDRMTTHTVDELPASLREDRS